MNIISWNCNMAFRKKFSRVINPLPDLLVIQECENKEKLQAHIGDFPYNQLFWYGDNIHKGIAVISFRDVHIEKSEDHQPEHRYIIPMILNYQNQRIHLFAIWAMPFKNSPAKSYVAQIWSAMKTYQSKLNEPSILIGDFNSNAIWDKTRKQGNHSQLVEFLDSYNITSVYHHLRNELHGEELEPTLYLLKKLHKPYHLDYCFVSKSFISNQTSIRIGKHNDWIKWSDHMPIFIDHIN